MSIIWRTSALAQRHAEIGGELEDWNGMGTAWFYDHTPERAKADYEAIRTKAGLMDVSGLKKSACRRRACGSGNRSRYNT